MPECRSVSEEVGQGTEAGETIEYHGLRIEERKQGADKNAEIVRVDNFMNQTGIGSNAGAGVAELGGGESGETDTDEETESEGDVRSNYVEVPLFWHPLGFKPCQQFDFQFMEEHDRKWPYAKMPLKQESKKGGSPLGDQKGEEASQAKTTMQSAAQALLRLAEALGKNENDLILMSNDDHHYYPDKRVLQHHRDGKKDHLKKKQAVDNGPNPLVNDSYAMKPFKTIHMSAKKKIAGNQSNDNVQSRRYMTGIGGEEGRIFTLPSNMNNNICFEIANQVCPCLPFKQIHPQVNVGLAGCRHACKLANPWDVRNPFL